MTANQDQVGPSPCRSGKGHPLFYLLQTLPIETLYCSISRQHVQRLQLIQNATADLLTHKRGEHIMRCYSLLYLPVLNLVSDFSAVAKMCILDSPSLNGSNVRAFTHQQGLFV